MTGIYIRWRFLLHFEDSFALAYRHFSKQKEKKRIFLLWLIVTFCSLKVYQSCYNSLAILSRENLIRNLIQLQTKSDLFNQISFIIKGVKTELGFVSNMKYSANWTHTHRTVSLFKAWLYYSNHSFNPDRPNTQFDPQLEKGIINLHHRTSSQQKTQKRRRKTERERSEEMGVTKEEVETTLTSALKPTHLVCTPVLSFLDFRSFS